MALIKEKSPENYYEILKKRYEEAMRLAGYEQVEVPEDDIATVGFRNPKINDEIYSDGWEEIAEYLHNMVILDDFTAERIEQLINREQTIEYYIEILPDDGASSFISGTLEEIMDIYDRHQEDKRIGIYITEKLDEKTSAYFDNLVGFYLNETKTIIIYDTQYQKSQLLSDAYNVSEAVKMYDSLADRLYRERVRFQVLDVLNHIKDDIITNITYDSKKTKWYCRVANARRPQDYIEISAEIRNRKQDIIFDMKSVHANEAVYAAETTIDLKTIETTDLDNEFDRTLEIRKMAECLDTDYERSFNVYSDSLEKFTEPLQNHIRDLNINGYEDYPSEPLIFDGYGKEILNGMSEDDREAHIQGVETARDYNEHVSDFDQRLYEVLINERKNMEAEKVKGGQSMEKYLYQEETVFEEAVPGYDLETGKELPPFVSGGAYEFFDTFDEALNKALEVWESKTDTEKEKYRNVKGNKFYVGTAEAIYEKNIWSGKEELRFANGDWNTENVNIIVDFTQPENILNFQLACCKSTYGELSLGEKIIDSLKNADILENAGIIEESLKKIKEVKLSEPSITEQVEEKSNRPPILGMSR